MQKIRREKGPSAVLPLWPDGPPDGVPKGLTQRTDERVNADGSSSWLLNDITAPTLSAFKPDRPTGEAILMMPGGGYRYIVVEQGDYPRARRFTRYGITVYVMTYRLPHQGWAAGPDAPLQDAQRAMRMVRSRAAEDGIDPDRVIAMGFSAGGHVAGSLGLRFDAALGVPGTGSARPDGLALVYPVATMMDPSAHEGSRNRLLGEGATEATRASYSLEEMARPDAPPTFFAHAADDASVPPDNAIMTFRALKAAGVPAALHIFAEGEHAFGMREGDPRPLGAWPDLMVDWWRAAKPLPAKR